ncbi:MAG: hypothetical protein QG639_62, partial [Patescibacteria group bacterium]|nr:hypothetical protein [Patescibacteria group bacterium]
MKYPSVSIICTVYNEAETIGLLLESFKAQTLKATEIIICDGGSTDKTVEDVTKFANQHPSLHIKLLTKEGNRSVGRNAAIAASTTKVIAITDAGCRPENDWLEQLLIAYQQGTANVVAGYYKGRARTSFEEAVIPYVLVMLDKVNPQSFLPATRSMLIEKKVWQQLDGFDE